MVRRQPSRPETDERWQIAIHEAGHAVVARVLSLTCGQVTIVPNKAKREAGHAIVAPPMRTWYDWELESQQQNSKWRDLHSAFCGTIIAKMAGAEAEIEIIGHCHGGDGVDRDEIEMMAQSADANFSEEEWERFEPRMRRQTSRLIRRHRAKIEMLARALLERRTISGPKIDALLGFDKRVN
jgi:ATP-dependent Zn protease